MVGCTTLQLRLVTAAHCEGRSPLVLANPLDTEASSAKRLSYTNAETDADLIFSVPTSISDSPYGTSRYFMIAWRRLQLLLLSVNLAMMNFESKIHEEILQTLERRSKIDMTKMSFVTALFSAGIIGRIGAGGDVAVDLFGALYLAPFVVLAFDCFIMREVWSLRRISDYLQHCEEDWAQIGGDADFESFIKKNNLRNPFYRWGSAGISAATIILAALLLWYQKTTLSIDVSSQNTSMLAMECIDLLWIVASAVAWLIIDMGGWLYVRNKFDRTNRQSE